MLILLNLDDPVYYTELLNDVQRRSWSAHHAIGSREILLRVHLILYTSNTRLVLIRHEKSDEGYYYSYNSRINKNNEIFNLNPSFGLACAFALCQSLTTSTCRIKLSIKVALQSPSNSMYRSEVTAWAFPPFQQNSSSKYFPGTKSVDHGFQYFANKSNIWSEFNYNKLNKCKKAEARLKQA